MSLYLELKTVASNDTPRKVISDAIDVAERVGVPVHVDVNGVLVIAFPGDDPEGLHQRWGEVLASRSPYNKVAAICGQFRKTRPA